MYYREPSQQNQNTTDLLTASWSSSPYALGDASFSLPDNPDQIDGLPIREQSDNLLYQLNPIKGKDTDRDKSFTYSIHSYHKASEQVAGWLITNSQYKTYHHLAIVKIREDWTANKHNEEWKKIRRRLKAKGIEAFWTREVNNRNWLHYNFTITSNQDAKTIKTILTSAFQGLAIEVHVEPIKSVVMWSRYIVKAKTQGRNEWGEWKKDKWASKRLLFRRHLGLDKHGTIGNFWSGGLTAIKKEAKQATDNYHTEQAAHYLQDKQDLQAQIDHEAQVQYRYQLDDWTIEDNKRETTEQIITRLSIACWKAQATQLSDLWKEPADQDRIERNQGAGRVGLPTRHPFLMSYGGIKGRPTRSPPPPPPPPPTPHPIGE